MNQSITVLEYIDLSKKWRNFSEFPITSFFFSAADKIGDGMAVKSHGNVPSVPITKIITDTCANS